MDLHIIWWIVAALSVALIVSVSVSIHFYRRFRREVFRKRSQSSKYGKLTEQFLPLVEMFPWNPSNFRFLGTPIDGVQFEDDSIIFVEFKAANSQLSKLQRHIRDLVRDGKVDFRVIRVDYERT